MPALLKWKLKLLINRGCPSLRRMTISFWLGILWWLKSPGLGAHTLVCTSGGHWTSLSITIGCRLFLLPSFLFKMFGSYFSSRWSIQWSDVHQFGGPEARFSQLVQLMLHDLRSSFKVSLKHFFWPLVLFPYCSWEQKICLERQLFGHLDTVTSPSKLVFDDDRFSTGRYDVNKDIKAKC